MISRFFIDRPIFATVLSVLITLIGGIALAYLPVAQYPRITPPGVSISISYPGANARTVRDTIAAPIEQQVNGVEGVLYMSSQMGNDGSYTLSITFDIGTDLKAALVKVQNRVTLAMPQLPIEAANQGITIRKKTPDILMIVNIFSPDQRYNDLYLSNYATIYLKDELLRVAGVSDINIQGLRDYSIRVWLDPQKLAGLGVTAGDVAAAIRAQNADAPAGRIGQPPSPNGQFFEVPIATLDRLSDPEQFGNIIVKAGIRQVKRRTPAPTISANGTGSSGTMSSLSSSLQSAGGMQSSGSSGSSTDTSSSSGTTTGGANSAGGGATGGGATTTTTDTPDVTDITDPTTGTDDGSYSDLSISGTGGSSAMSATMGGGPGRPSAAIVRLKDVARIDLGAQNYNSACTFDGHQAVGLMLYQLPGTNALEVADRVRAKMEQLKARFPDGIKYDIGYDTTPYIRDSVNEVMRTLFEAVVLVGIVVLIFLQDWRAMILPMIDVPVSLIGTFAVMYVLGFSLNNISLFGLVLAIGIVVDDAIVVLENIERLMATGLDVRTATIKAMDEVTGPIIAVALVLSAVFIPCAFISGVTGQFFRQFAITISVSTVISAINAITMTPSRAVLLFKADPQHGGESTAGVKGHTPHREALPWWGFAALGGYITYRLGLAYLSKPAEEGAISITWLAWFTTMGTYAAPGIIVGGIFGWFLIRPVNTILGWLFRGFNRGFDSLAYVFGWIIGKQLRLSAVVLVFYGGMMVLAWYVFQQAPVGFIPQQDQGRLMVSVQLPDSASLQRTQEVLAKVVQIARETKGVQHIVATAGMSFLLQANSSNFASGFIVLDGFDKRQTPGLRDTAIMAKLKRRWDKEVPEAKVTVNGTSPIPGLGTAGGFKLIVEDRGGLGLDQLQKQTDNLVRELQKIPGLNNVITQFRSATPQLYADINRDKAEALGVALADVNQALGMYLGSSSITLYPQYNHSWQVTVQADGKFRSQVDAINLFKVRNAQGAMVPLGTIVTMKEVTGPLSATRYNLYGAAAISGNVATGYSTGDAINEINDVALKTLPLSMKTEWTEIMFLQIKAGNTAIYAFFLGVACAFLALAALYESWWLPLAVIMVVPLCPLCSVAGVLLSPYFDGARRDVNIFVQIGLIVLVGLACKNAILIVEYAKQLHQEGKSIWEATVEAARWRLRPILMTSFAFILGVAPLAWASGAGAEMRRSLGIAVFSGMLGVTIFGIFLTPVFFYVIQRLNEAPLFAGENVRWALSCFVGASLGAICGYLLGQLGVVHPGWGAIVGGAAGICLMMAALEVRRRMKTPATALSEGERHTGGTQS
jgi:multidrug efflux pump